MHIWIINQSFRPETNAPANRFHGLATQWEKLGQRVTVLAGQPYRPHGKLAEGFNGQFQEKQVDGITVRYHWEWITRKKKALAQALTQLSFAWSLLRKNWRVTPENRPDIIIASSPDFFHTISAWLLSVRYRVPFIMEVRDLWPEIFKDMGVLNNRALLWLLEKLARFIYVRAKNIITVTNGYAKQLTEKGVNASKIYVIHNAVGDADFDAADDAIKNKAGNNLRSELQIAPLSKVVLYVGNHGKAQALSQIIDAARSLINRNDIHFLIVGDGADKQRLVEMAKGIPNIQFLPNQPKEKVWAMYDMCTISISCLRDIPSFATTIPSKINEIMAAKKPVIACLQGEAAEIVETSGGGIVVPPETPEKLATAIKNIIDAPDKLEKMATSGRAFVDKHRRYSQLAQQYLGILQQAQQKKKKDDV
ncbi:MAG: glycosyltransferase family 4 protein [Alphaproteobacteria bacterium]|nr:glycosyltransferase family 4 protein [Alphaproteobacteria bacterium]